MTLPHSTEMKCMSIYDVDPQHKALISLWVRFFIQTLGGAKLWNVAFSFWEICTNLSFYIVVFTAQRLFSFALILCNQWRVWSISSKTSRGIRIKLKSSYSCKVSWKETVLFSARQCSGRGESHETCILP